jgi:Uncharacterized protein conserved in bacteria (DUF2334)
MQPGTHEHPVPRRPPGSGSAPPKRPARPFIVCVHDATPAFARETRVMIRDLAPLVRRRLSFGVVPNWCGEWPLTAHPDYCRLLRESSEERLLHGYLHRRQRGRGPVSWLVGGSDEMNGLDPEQTRRTLERGQDVFTEAFGEPAKGFIAPAWQLGHLHRGSWRSLGLDHVFGFFALDSLTRPRVPLATWTWDCGRWGWLGHVGHGIGGVLHSSDRRIPTLAIHPADLERGFWLRILRLIDELLDAGYEPTTPAALIEAGVVESHP